MFDRGLNWEKREDGTILYRRTPAGPTFVIEQQALDSILHFRLLIPFVSFLTLLPAVILGVVAGHGEVSFEVPVVALLLGVATFYVYFRHAERKIERILAGARQSSQSPEPLKSPRNARNWATLDDGSVFYWPRNWGKPVVLTDKQFASIGTANGHIFFALFVSTIVGILADGYRWAGMLGNGAAVVIAIALISLNVLFFAKILQARRLMLDRAPSAPADSGVKPPQSLPEVVRTIFSLVRMKLVQGSKGLLSLSLVVAALGLFQSMQTLSDLFAGAGVYWDTGRSVPVGPPSCLRWLSSAASHWRW